MELAGDPAEVRKARGAFFTPPEVTSFLAAWAIRQQDDRVLEPSCGDGAILEAVALRARHLGGTTPIVGYELHEPSAAEARSLLDHLGYPATITVGDFLATSAAGSFDAVIGNPPYIRYQGFTGDARATGIAAAFAQGVRLSRLASSWAPFVIHASAHLQPQGRLALVLPAELLGSNYAQEVRDYLLARFASLSVVLFGRHVFPGVQTEAVLLLAEGTGGTRHVRFAVVDDSRALPGVSFDTELELRPGQRWTAALVSQEAQERLLELTDRGEVAPLGSWGRLSLGAVTGSNKFFLLSPARASDLGLCDSDLVPISPPGSSHLRALTLTGSQHQELGRDGAATLLFRPTEPSPGARAYIDEGQRRGVDQAYKCRVRSPWWRTPLQSPPDLFFTYMNEAMPQLAANPERLHHVNSVHGVYLREQFVELAPLLALAALNSATALSAEIAGRSYGGGVLKMEPREAASLLVPTPEVILRHRGALQAMLAPARELLASGHLPEVVSAVDRILFAAVLAPEHLSDVRGGYATLSGRRRRRAASPRHERTRS